MTENQCANFRVDDLGQRNRPGDQLQGDPVLIIIAVIAEYPNTFLLFFVIGLLFFNGFPYDGADFSLILVQKLRHHRRRRSLQKHVPFLRLPQKHLADFGAGAFFSMDAAVKPRAFASRMTTSFLSKALSRPANPV